MSRLSRALSPSKRNWPKLNDEAQEAQARYAVKLVRRNTKDWSLPLSSVIYLIVEKVCQD